MLTRAMAWAAASILLLAASTALAEPAPREPGPKDQCGICGMYVAPFPDWLAQVTFADDRTAYFDGPKCMFRYLFGLEKYAPSRAREDVEAIFVTGYYERKPIAAGEAYFVQGSDVYGPMGHELVAFASEEEAMEFRQDHKGKEILRLGDITPDVIAELD